MWLHARPAHQRWPSDGPYLHDGVAARRRELPLLGFRLAVVAALLQSAAHLTNAYLLGGEVVSFDAGADGEGNAFTWASSCATFAAALFACLVAFLDGSRRRTFVLLAAALAFFSLDDFTQLHESAALGVVRAVGVDEAFGRTVWPVLLFPLLAFVVVVLWRVAAAAAREAFALRLGLGLLAAAVALEMGFIVVPAGGAVWTVLEPIEIALEEGAELGGWILIATGLCSLFVEVVTRPIPVAVAGTPQLAAVPPLPDEEASSS